MVMEREKKLTIKELKERIKAKYGYDGRFIDINKLADDIYFYLIDERTIKCHKVNIFSNDNIIKISTKDILRNVLDKRLSFFKGQIGQALKVLHDRGLIEIVKKKSKPGNVIYYIKI